MPGIVIEFPRLQTPRVNLRLLTLDDAEAVFRHFSDAEVTAFMDIETLRSVAEAKEIISFHLEDSGCRWGLFCRASQKLVGTCGYHRWQTGEHATAEIGFDLARAYWGMGLMREVLPPVLAVGFRRMGLARIEATVEPANTRCIAVLEALGFDVEANCRDGRRVFFVDSVARTLRVTGQVQGVGFRPFVYRLACSLDLSGHVRNDPAGVTIEVQGPPDTLDAFAARLISDAPLLARVDEIRRIAGRASGDGGPFRIIASEHEGDIRGRIAVDSATCDDCLREMRDAADRRQGHALLNCTNCGPRYTIVRDLPYDRPLTTMAPFPLCATCRAEYDDPADRRFHAQPTCCPDCGPRLRLEDREGREISGDPILTTAARIREGAVLAVKGLGGYHLVVDAANEAAVARLRGGKRRDAKPFAVMAKDLEAVKRLVELSDVAAQELVSPARPILLAPRVSGAAVASNVAPRLHRLGVMLPSTPIQFLLFDQGLGPLVMTSANHSDDPLLADDAEVRQRLGDVCNAFLCHDRVIERAVDDSIWIDAHRGLVPLRRARGYVPTPLSLPVPSPDAGLCVGGDLKNTVAIVRGDEVIVSQHLGDLGYTLAWRRFERTIEDLCRLYDVSPHWVACDAHPDYRGHVWAHRFGREQGLEVTVVQHHHAHLASVLAEQGRVGPTIGLICDGVGYGADGTAWGGEILVGDLADFRRVGRLRPLRLPGGDAAAKETGRPALSWLIDGLGPTGLDHAAAATALPNAERRAQVIRLLQSDVNCPPSSGVGRLFDAAAALLGICRHNHHEALSGMRLEALAAGAATRPSGDGIVPLEEAVGGPDLRELDHRPLLEALLNGLDEHQPVAELAFLFHDALADALARAASWAGEQSGIRCVVLSGGVFLNALLTERLSERLEARGFEVLLHQRVPPGDGGIAYGQAAVATARRAEE